VPLVLDRTDAVHERLLDDADDVERVPVHGERRSDAQAAGGRKVRAYHGGAFVVFSKALNPNLTVLALEGSFASVLTLVGVSTAYIHDRIAVLLPGLAAADLRASVAVSA